MSRRSSSRGRRRTSRPEPISISIPDPARRSVRSVVREPVREPGRGTFAVARAHRALADALPDVVKQRSRDPMADRKPVRVAVGSRLDKTTALSKRQAKQPERQVKPPLTMRDKTCKSPPRSTRGSGGSRPFVPWCKK